MSKKTIKDVKKEYFVDRLVSEWKSMSVSKKIGVGLIGVILAFQTCSKGLECSGIEIRCDKGKPKIENYNSNSAWKGERKPTNPYTKKGVIDTTKADLDTTKIARRDTTKSSDGYSSSNNTLNPFNPLKPLNPLNAPGIFDF